MTKLLPYAAVALASAGAAVIGTTALSREGAGGAQVRAYLLEHPEVLQEAMERLRLKQAAAQIAPLRRDLETPFARGYIGAERPDITLVQFFDYACGYCRASLADVQRLVAADPKLRVVFRELPILSRESETAARASLVAAQQGRYAAFHTAMYAQGRPSAAGVMRAAQAAGMSPIGLDAAMKAPDKAAELSKNVELARALGVTGTPAWVIGDQVLSGAVGYGALKDAVANARGAM
jgi:protein-disulfide isomerase